MSKDFTLMIFVVLATLSSGLLGSAALAAVRGSARIPLKYVTDRFSFDFTINKISAVGCHNVHL